MGDVQTMLGADIDSDHNLLVAKICTRLKEIIKFQTEKLRGDLESMAESAQYSRRKTRCNRM
jgi:hypothetical protein